MHGVSDRESRTSILLQMLIIQKLSISRAESMQSQWSFGGGMDSVYYSMELTISGLTIERDHCITHHLFFFSLSSLVTI